MSVRFQSPELAEADGFYLVLEGFVTRYAEENNSLPHGESVLSGESFAML
jgi:hypothetical protein